MVAGARVTHRCSEQQDRGGLLSRPEVFGELLWSRFRARSGCLPGPARPLQISPPVTAGAAGSGAGADARHLGEPRARGGHVGAPGGTRAEAGGSPGPAPPSGRLWGV